MKGCIYPPDMIRVTPWLLFKGSGYFFKCEKFVILKKEILLQSDYYLTCELYKLLILFEVQ